MSTSCQHAEIAVNGRQVNGEFVSGAGSLPAILFVHGWDSGQAHYQMRAEEVAALGCICLTFDMRGHGRHAAQHGAVTREDNLRDVLAAYDTLVNQPGVDAEAVAVVGTSYGAYLAAIASALRPVRWLALRVPALYPDAQWDIPKDKLDRSAIELYRQTVHRPPGNRALTACERFRGDVLVVESELDMTVAHPTIESFVGAFGHAKSLTYRCIAGADHALSDEHSQQAYDALFMAWLSEMLLGARTGSPKPE